jgi:hypothetical protein
MCRRSQSPSEESTLDPTGHEGNCSMGIVFFCQSCGARFEVDPRLAGKRGRCKKCSQFMAIPRGEELASMAAMPALAAAAGTGAVADSNGISGPSWLAAGISKAVLAPITLDRMPVGRIRPPKPSPLDDAEDSKPYLVQNPVNENRGQVRAQDNAVMRLWRQQIGGVIKIFRKLNQTAYLISVPFVMILLFGAVMKNRQIALFGATVVVLLNIARLVTGVVNVAIVPLRDGIEMTKLKKPLQRVIEPVITIGLVIVAFTFIPWLAQGKSTKGSVSDRLSKTATSLKGEMQRDVDSAFGKAKNLDIEKLGAQVQRQLGKLGSPSGGSPAQMPNNGSEASSPESAINGLIQGVGQHARDVVNESQP